MDIKKLLAKINAVTALAGVFALVSVQNIADFFIALHHPWFASWTLGIALGCALVLLAKQLSEIDMKERRAFWGLLSVTLVFVLVSGIMQGSTYAKEIGWTGYLLAFTLTATGEIVLPLAHSWHSEAKRRKMVNDAGLRVEEMAAQTLIDTMASVDTTKAARQAEKLLEGLIVSNIHEVVRKLSPHVSVRTEEEERPELPKPHGMAALKIQADAVRLNGKEEAKAQLLEVYKEDPDLSLNEAGERIGKSKSTVASYVKELETEGRLFMNGAAHVIE